MKTSHLALCVLATTAAIATPAAADTFAPGHGCTQPYKPYEFTSQYQVDQFQRDVEIYKSCITTFVSNQRAEAQKHNQAASRAIDEWNHFVDFELQ